MTEVQQIAFEGSLGHSLSAKLNEPSGEVKAYALFAHCFTCSKDINATSRIARHLAEQQIGVLRFDFTGLGHSEGSFGETTFESNIGDLLAAAQWLRSEREAPSILIGHSLGGAAVLATAGSVPECKAVVTIGAPSEPKHVLKLIGPSVDAIERDGHASVSLGGRPIDIGKDLIHDLQTRDPKERIGTMQRPLLVFHSETDTTVGIENATQIFTWAKHPKSFVSLDGADHLLSNSDDAKYVAQILVAWAERWIGH